MILSNPTSERQSSCPSRRPRWCWLETRLKGINNMHFDIVIAIAYVTGRCSAVFFFFFFLSGKLYSKGQHKRMAEKTQGRNNSHLLGRIDPPKEIG